MSEVGYLGKDYTALSVHMDMLPIENKEIFLETILRLDEKVIKKAAEDMKREREKLKSKIK